jgi:hypothetical protein
MMKLNDAFGTISTGPHPISISESPPLRDAAVPFQPTPSKIPTLGRFPRGTGSHRRAIGAPILIGPGRYWAPLGGARLQQSLCNRAAPGHHPPGDFNRRVLMGSLDQGHPQGLTPRNTGHE